MSAPQITFQPFASVSGVYATGLEASPASSALSGTAASEGATVTAGVGGAHSWKHTTVGLDYSWGMTRYSQASGYNSTTQALLLRVTHQLSKHIGLSLRENAGEFYRNYGTTPLSETATFDPSSGYVPTSAYYYTRTIYASSQADVTIQKSTRLSFNLGGDTFLNQYRAPQLYGLAGAGARGDIEYRLTSRSTVGVAYMYTKYKYRGIYSGTNVHSWALTYGVRLSKAWELSTYGGVEREETTFVEQFAINPVLGALLGLNVRAAVVDQAHYLGMYNGRLSYVMRRGVASVSVSHAVMPGNGLFLTSTSTVYDAGYTYSGFRKWSMSVDVAEMRSESIGNVLGEYGSASGTLSVSRQIWAFIHGVAGFAVRKYNSGSFANYNQFFYTATLGVGFTPGGIPVRFW
jgi:hypothetical protein